MNLKLQNKLTFILSKRGIKFDKNVYMHFEPLRLDDANKGLVTLL